MKGDTRSLDTGSGACNIWHQRKFEGCGCSVLDELGQYVGSPKGTKMDGSSFFGRLQLRFLTACLLSQTGSLGYFAPKMQSAVSIRTDFKMQHGPVLSGAMSHKLLFRTTPHPLIVV